MTPETAKKFEALSVEDKAALERYVSMASSAPSVDAFIDGIEGQLFSLMI